MPRISMEVVQAVSSDQVLVLVPRRLQATADGRRELWAACHPARSKDYSSIQEGLGELEHEELE